MIVERLYDEAQADLEMMIEDAINLDLIHECRSTATTSTRDQTGGIETETMIGERILVTRTGASHETDDVLTIRMMITTALHDATMNQTEGTVVTVTETGETNTVSRTAIGIGIDEVNDMMITMIMTTTGAETAVRTRRKGELLVAFLSTTRTSIQEIYPSILIPARSSTRSTSQ